MADLPILVGTIAFLGALAAGGTALGRPLRALGVLFVLASASRITLETPVGTMRLEQPAIAMVAVVLVTSGRWRGLRSAPRVVTAAAAAFALYLAVITLASALIPPDPVLSLRLAIWQAISMVAGVVTFLLVRTARGGAVQVFAVGGAVTGAVGLTLAVAFLAFGPSFAVGIQDPDSVLPRVHAWSREANLYASFLAICAPFAIEAARRSRRWLLGVVLIVVALPLGATRGADIALIAGLAAYMVVHLASVRRLADLSATAAAVAITFVVGLFSAGALLPNPVERYTADTGVIVEPSSVTATILSSPKPGPSTTPRASPLQSSSPSPSLPPPPSLAPVPDTVSFRMERVPLALDDFRKSPLIGLGASSFGQLHGDPSQGGLPDHLAILAIATLHDSGLLGALALLVGFSLVGYGLLARARFLGQVGDRLAVGTMAAYAGSITAMVVAYQATNALHFSINWMIIGGAAAVIASVNPGRVDSGPPTN